MKIIIETIPLQDQYCDTLGDWRFLPDGTLKVYVSECGDDRAHLAVAIHETIEAILCKEHGISDDVVTAYDVQFEKDVLAGLKEDGEPGEQEDAPYKAEHAAATRVERAVIKALGWNWRDYLKFFARWRDSIQ